ncbi:putative transposase [Burkholderia ambifaria]|nr:putative transposase [Burkholderia ambifaria]
MKKRFTDEQIIRILREAESRDEPVKDLCKRLIAEQLLVIDGLKEFSRKK